jgi:hypothetical protein
MSMKNYYFSFDYKKPKQNKNYKNYLRIQAYVAPINIYRLRTC